MPTTRGSLPPAVYWRRRIFVVGTVLALVLIVVNVVRGGGGSSTPSTTATQVAGQPTALPSTDEPSSTGKSKGKNKGKSTGKNKGKNTGQTTLPDVTYTPPPVPEPAEPTGTCDDADIRVTPSVPGAVAGQAVAIRLTLQTLTAEACTWRINREHLALKITDGDDEVWTTRECLRQVPTADVVVRSASTSTFDFTWNGRRSDPGCTVDQPFADAGSYEVQVSSFGGEPSDVVSFELTDPSEVFVPDAPLGPEVPGAGGRDRDKNRGKPDGAVEPDQPCG